MTTTKPCCILLLSRKDWLLLRDRDGCPAFKDENMDNHPFMRWGKADCYVDHHLPIIYPDESELGERVL